MRTDLNTAKFIEIGDHAIRRFSPLIINKKDGSILVKIPAGEFVMGDGKDSDNPPHTVYLDTYYIGVYAVTNRQYKKFADETGHRPPDHADYTWGGGPKWKGNTYPAELSDHPVVCVNWEDASAYCRWAGLSLPTEAQWEKAARGPEGYLYPWGNEWEENRCRHSGNRGSAETCRVYDYAEGVSGYGAYNMSGNVWEWCSDWYDSGYYKVSPRDNPCGPDQGSLRVYRGGSWFSGAVRCRSAIRDIVIPLNRRDSFGFRAVCAPTGQQP